MVPYLFVGFGALLLATAVMVVLHKNPVTSALFLVLSFCSLAGIYLLLQAEFIGFVQIIVYAGAIMVLFLFVVMLLNAPHEDTELDARVDPMLRPGARSLGAVLAVALVAELIWALITTNGSASFPSAPVVSVATIGRRLFTDYAFPFEVTSVLILVAMVGAVVMARQETQARGKR